MTETPKTEYTREEIEGYVIDSIAKQLFIDDKNKITLESKLQNLGADSLDAVELVMDYEDHFNIKIPDEDAEKMQTPGNIVDYLIEKTAA